MPSDQYAHSEEDQNKDYWANGKKTTIIEETPENQEV